MKEILLARNNSSASEESHHELKQSPSEAEGKMEKFSILFLTSTNVGESLLFALLLVNNQQKLAKKISLFESRLPFRRQQQQFPVVVLIKNAAKIFSLLLFVGKLIVCIE